jgi:hypothetical protein
MSVALELIVDGYIRLNDRGAIAGLKAHRENLLVSLRAQSGGCFDVSGSIGQMEEELAQIEAGLKRLDEVTASARSNDLQAPISTQLF